MAEPENLNLRPVGDTAGYLLPPVLRAQGTQNQNRAFPVHSQNREYPFAVMESKSDTSLRCPVGAGVLSPLPLRPSRCHLLTRS